MKSKNNTKARVSRGNLRKILPIPLLIIVSSLFVVRAFSSNITNKKWSLEKCVSYAMLHNYKVKEQIIECEKQKIEVSNSKNSRLPNLSGQVFQDFNFGRSLTYENTYTNTSTRTSTIKLTSSIPLFTGFKSYYQTQRERLILRSCVLNLEKIKNDVRTNVTDAYFQILYSKELKDISKRQVYLDSLLLHQMGILERYGKVSQSDLAQQKAALANSMLSLTENISNLKMSKLNMVQLLELDYSDSFDIEVPDVDVNSIIVAKPNEVYQIASENRPEIKGELCTLENIEKEIKISKSYLYPQISLGAGIGTNYYS